MNKPTTHRENLPALIGRNVAARRLVLDLTQAEVAARAGCHRVTVARIEAGELTPSFELMEELAAALETPPRALLEPDQPPRRAKKLAKPA